MGGPAGQPKRGLREPKQPLRQRAGPQDTREDRAGGRARAAPECAQAEPGGVRPDARGDGVPGGCLRVAGGQVPRRRRQLSGSPRRLRARNRLPSGDREAPRVAGRADAFCLRGRDRARAALRGA